MADFNTTQLTAIGERLQQTEATIAVAESVTSGLMQYAFSNIPKALNFYHGGITAYNLAQKFKHTDVEPVHASAVDCVSAKVAAQMALNVCKHFSSHWGIGITGYSTPTPASGGRIFAYYAIAYEGAIRAESLIEPTLTEATEVQQEYVNTVVDKLYQLLHPHA
ncbi:CinA family protein [Chitinophaga sedimenti]|uniref:CinA family protein n=1 Tax=Chitinophaga sedimenti TaxID=2033606 RepID=UPI002005E79B|nr:CinA family protein [Chitinophaga sedimenti]MCK7555607.1 CinA family protein [Chitinophaga sedimenti]